MATHVGKIFSLIFLLLIISCAKKNQVYYNPTGISKQSINVAKNSNELNLNIEQTIKLNPIDSPINGNIKSDTNRAIIKKYNFDEPVIKEEIENKNQANTNKPKTAKGRFTTLIVGLILFSIGFIWLIVISNRSYNSYDSILYGCWAVLLSLSLTIAGAITSIIGLIMGLINN
jgi:hypothetical protein